VSVAPVLFANAVLLFGLFALGWAPRTVAFLFWFEAAVAGAVTLLKVAASLPGNLPASGQSVTYRRQPRPGSRASVSTTVPRIAPLRAIPLFILSYGTVLAGYGALLLQALGEEDFVSPVNAALAADGARFAMAVIAGEHLWAFWRGFVRGPAWQRSDPTFHFWRPFGLAIVAWLAFLLGFLMLGWLDRPLAVLTILILLKAAAELFSTFVDAQAGEWERLGDSS
jgi:Family of unknown function (DUF6498)